MPTYDLKCAECGHRFELFLMRLLRDEDRTCPECGSPEARAGVGGGFVTRASAPASCVPRGGFT